MASSGRSQEPQRDFTSTTAMSLVEAATTCQLPGPVRWTPGISGSGVVGLRPGSARLSWHGVAIVPSGTRPADRQRSCPLVGYRDGNCGCLRARVCHDGSAISFCSSSVGSIQDTLVAYGWKIPPTASSPRRLPTRFVFDSAIHVHFASGSAPVLLFALMSERVPTDERVVGGSARLD